MKKLSRKIHESKLFKESMNNDAMEYLISVIEKAGKVEGAHSDEEQVTVEYASKVDEDVLNPLLDELMVKHNIGSALYEDSIEFYLSSISDAEDIERKYN